MKLEISETQFKNLVKGITENKNINEQDAAAPSPEPTAGTSATQAGATGYPQVGKWESGATRGPANQIGVTKWADIVGSSLKRGKANQLK